MVEGMLKSKRIITLGHVSSSCMKKRWSFAVCMSKCSDNDIVTKLGDRNQNRSNPLHNSV